MERATAKVTAKEKADTKESRRAKATSRRRMSTVSRSSDGEMSVGGMDKNGLNTESNEKENGGKVVC